MFQKIHEYYDIFFTFLFNIKLSEKFPPRRVFAMSEQYSFGIMKQVLGHSLYNSPLIRNPEHMRKVVVMGANAFVSEQDIFMVNKVADVSAWSAR